MMLHIKTMRVKDAVEVIQCAVKRPCFQTTPQSQAVLNNLVLSSQVEAEMKTVTVSPKFQVVIPREVRESLSIKPGEKMQVINYADGSSLC